MKPLLILLVFVVVGLTVLFLNVPSQTVDKAGDAEPKLSLEQAVGQVLLMGFEGSIYTLKLKTLMQKIQPGGILLLGRNIQDKAQLKTLVRDLENVSQIPLLVAVDQEGGIVSRVPWVESTAQSALQSSEQAFLVGERRGQELQELGITMNLAPVLDSGSFKDFLFERTFQKSKMESAEYARSLILGQMESGVLSVVKHYPGYDGILVNPELQTIPRKHTFPNTDVFLRLFSQVSTPFLMLSHVIYEDVDEEYPLVLSLAGMKEVRSRVGSEKIIVSDDLLSEAFLNVYELKGLGTRAMYSGVDILLVAGYPDAVKVEQFYDEFLAAAKKDDILARHIRQAAARILSAKRAFLVF